MGSFDLTSELAAALLGCLCGAVSGAPNPPQHCCYRVGTEPVHDISLEGGVDLCCEGLAYVLLGDTYASTDSFPDNDIVRQANQRCYPPGLAVNFRMGIVRCVPDTSDCAANNAAFTQNLYDSQSLKVAGCCIRQFLAESTTFMGMSIAIQRQVQGSTSGGCTERYVNLAIQIPNTDCC